MPNSAERRSTINGPNEMPPKLNGPSLKISHDRIKTIAPGISSGDLIVNSLDASLAGKTIDKNPKIKERTNKNIRDLHQIRGGSKLRTVINKRTECGVVLLDENAKVNELAAMISGQKITSESISYAKGMLKN